VSPQQFAILLVLQPTMIGNVASGIVFQQRFAELDLDHELVVRELYWGSLVTTNPMELDISMWRNEDGI
jgi:hypothetical protein